MFICLYRSLMSEASHAMWYDPHQISVVSARHALTLLSKVASHIPKAIFRSRGSRLASIAALNAVSSNPPDEPVAEAVAPTDSVGLTSSSISESSRLTDGLDDDTMSSVAPCTAAAENPLTPRLLVIYCRFGYNRFCYDRGLPAGRRIRVAVFIPK